MDSAERGEARNSETDLEDTVELAISSLFFFITEDTEAAEKLTLAARSDSVTNELDAAKEA